VDSDQFANRATAALGDESVRSLIVERTIIQSVVSSVVGGRAFTGIFRKGVRAVHRAVLDRDRNMVALTVADIGTIVAAGIEAIRPALARRLETTRRVNVLRPAGCGRLRGQIPNLVAVNFYRRGDVSRVVETLNGVR
jgi:hypothetical protein